MHCPYRTLNTFFLGLNDFGKSNCDLICNYFLKLFIFCIQQRQVINHCIVCSVGHVTLKKQLVILLVTSHK